jgi:hypothetical protein
MRNKPHRITVEEIRNALDQVGWDTFASSNTSDAIQWKRLEVAIGQARYRVRARALNPATNKWETEWKTVYEGDLLETAVEKYNDLD